METPRSEHTQHPRRARRAGVHRALRGPVLLTTAAVAAASCTGDTPAPDGPQRPAPDSVAAAPVEIRLDDQAFTFELYPGGDLSARTPITD